MTHLSSDQLSEWALGERTAVSTRHVASCLLCQSKIEQFEEALGGFRESVRAWSETEVVNQSALAWPDKPVRWNWRPVAAIAAVGLMIALILATFARHETRPLTASSFSASEDAALLSQIDQEVSPHHPGRYGSSFRVGGRRRRAYRGESKWKRGSLMRTMTAGFLLSLAFLTGQLIAQGPPPSDQGPGPHAGHPPGPRPPGPALRVPLPVQWTAPFMSARQAAGGLIRVSRNCCS